MSSGFSFLVPKTAVIRDESTSVTFQPTSTSSESHSDSATRLAEGNEISLLGAPIASDDNIKLFKSSEARLLKKKKRGPKVGFARGATEDEADGPQSHNGYEPSLSDTVSQPDFDSTSSVGDEEATHTPSVTIDQHVAPSRDLVIEVVNKKTTESLTSDDNTVRNGHQPDIKKIAVATDIEPSAVRQSTSSLQSEILQQVKGVTSDDVSQLNGQRSMKSWQGEKLPSDPYAEVIQSSVTTARSDLTPSLMFDGMSLSSKKEETFLVSDHSSGKFSGAMNKAAEENMPLRIDRSSSEISAERSSQLSPLSALSPIHSETLKDDNAAKQPSLSESIKAVPAYNEPKPIPAAANTVKPVGAQDTKLSTDIGLDSKLKKSGGRLISETLCSDFSNRMAPLLESQLQIASERSGMRQELLSVEGWLIEAGERLLAMEENQLRLAALEEFDQADSLNCVMEDLQREILSQNQRLKFLQDQTARVPGSSIDYQLSLIQDAQAKSISDLVSALCYAVEEEKYQAAKKERLEDDSLTREAERLKGERDRISVEEAYTAEEEKILSEQTGEMEMAIAAQAGSAIERRDSVKALKDNVSLEIMELERQLVIKRAEEETLSRDLEEICDRISTVRSSFHRQIQRIEDRKALMTETKTSWQLDQASLVAGEDAHNLEASRIKRTRQSTAVWCSRVGRDVSALKTVLEALRPTPSSSSSSSSEAPVPSEIAPEGSLLSTRARLEAVHASLSEALKDQVELTALGVNLVSEAKEVQDLCFKLETEKKSHAVARRFKEAALVAKDEKSLIQRRDDLAGMIESNTMLQLEKNAEVLELRNSRNILAGEVSSADALADKMRHSDLRDRVSAIEAVRAHVASIKAEISEPIPDSEEMTEEDAAVSPLVSLSLHLLSSQIEVLNIELRDLETLYPTLCAEERVSDSDEGTGEADPSVSSEERSRGAEEPGETSPSPTPTPDSGSAVSGESPVSEPDEGAEDPGGAPHDEGAVGSSSLSDTSGGPSESDIEAQEAARALLITKAKDVTNSIIGLEQDLMDATNEEDYELADKIDGEITDAKAETARLLQLLHLTEEQLAAMT